MEGLTPVRGQAEPCSLAWSETVRANEPSSSKAEERARRRARVVRRRRGR
jgi:hypothetical protein